MGQPRPAIAAYREALGLMKGLRRAYPDRQEYARDEAELLCDLGISHKETDQSAEAERAYRRALAIQEPLAARPNPEDADLNSLARTRMNLAMCLRDGPRVGEAHALFLQALVAWADLNRRFPTNRYHQESLGICAIDLGCLNSALGRIQQARDRLEMARRVFEQLVRTDPAAPQHRYQLGTALYNLGVMSDSQADLNRLREARNVLDEVARRSPGMAPYQEQLARTCLALGHRLGRTTEQAEAEAAFRLTLEARQRLVQRYPDRLDYQEQLGKAHVGLGELLRWRGRLAEAEKSFLAVLDIFERLHQRDAKRLEFHAWLGHAHDLLGMLYHNLERREEGARHHRRALAIREQLAREKPSVSHRARVANSCTNLANLCPGPVTVAEAEKLNRRAIELQRVLVKEDPGTVQHTLDYAMSYNNLGLLYLREDRLAEAATAWQEALRIREELLRRPGASAHLMVMVMSHRNLALLGDRRQQVDSALAHHRKAVEYGRRLVRLQPDNAEGIMRVGEAYMGLSAWLGNRGRFLEAATEADRGLRLLARWDRQPLQTLPPWTHRALLALHGTKALWLTQLRAYPQALPHWDRLVALSAGDEHDLSRLSRARVLAQAGKHVRASDEAVALAARPNPAPGHLLALAETHALASQAAAQDDRLGEQRRKDTADLYARRAVGLLRELHAGGGFKTAKARQMLLESPELKCLHERDDFRQFLSRLEGKTP
jgi:tetratricopeptide (TPR) repeat protein